MSLATRAEKAGYKMSPAMQASVYDGRAWATMVGCGESYLTPFAILLQATPVQLSLLVSIPPFFGALAHMVGIWMLQFLHSRRTLIIRSVMVNAFIWLPLSLCAFLSQPGSTAVWWTMGLAMIYQISAGIGTPAWNSLMGDFVPTAVRGRFFGLRNADIALATFLGMFLAGQLLGISQQFLTASIGFAIVFLIAGIIRCFSVYWLKHYEDIAHPPHHAHYFSFWAFLRGTPRSNFVKFVLYTSMINGAVAFSAPFFGLFMLNDLKFSYPIYAAVTATVVVVQFFTMQYWGRLVDAFGSKQLLNVLGCGVVFTPILWVLDHSLPYIFLIQAINGFIWAGFNLAAANFLFEAVTPVKRARCTAYQAVVNGFFVMVGSLLGGIAATNLPRSITLFSFTWTPLSSLEFLFILSGVIRLVAASIFLPRIVDAAGRQKTPHKELLFRMIGLPQSADISFAVLNTFKRKRDK